MVAKTISHYKLLEKIGIVGIEGGVPLLTT